MTRFWLFLAGLNGFIAVGMGAVASHVITDPQLAGLAEKASYYQLIHAVLLIVISSGFNPFVTCARWFVLAGLVLFCGGIYLHALQVAQSAPMAPAGGASFMIAWVLIALAALKPKP
jgi:uncharacterized membrane protein YgdD (TMEM256/DUF423 family)